MLNLTSTFGLQLLTPLANLWLEASVVAAVCSVFLILFVAAGINQIIKDKKTQ